MNVWVVIPAWNEGKRKGYGIVKVLDELTKENYNVVVVDDGSTDETNDIIKKHNVKLLRHKINRGQGASLQTGNEYALRKGADIIVHFDADGQFLVSEIKDFVKILESGDCDIVFGSRFLGKESEMPWLKKHIYFPIGRIVNLVMGGIKMTDPQSGFRAMTRETAKRITIEQDGWAHCSEILFKAFEYKLRVKEVPIKVLYKEFGQNLAGGIKIFADLFIRKISK